MFLNTVFFVIVMFPWLLDFTSSDIRKRAMGIFPMQTVEICRCFCYNDIMDWFNYYGLAIMAVIMIPNIIYAVKHKNSESAYRNRAIEILKQIGRYGCFILMIFNIPYTYFNFWFDHALIVYLCVNGALCLAYLIFWVICWNRDNKLKALSLSIIPSMIFVFSGIVLADIPLFVFSVIFAINHILISYQNVA